MIIGYYCYGAISLEEAKNIQKNGKIESSVWYRKIQLDYLSSLGHEIYLMNDKRSWHKHEKFDCLKNSKTFSPGNFYSKVDWVVKDGSIKLEESWVEMYKNINKVNWPKIDLLILDNAGYPLFPIFTYKLMLILAYKDKIPVIVLDDDNHTEKIFPRFNKALGFNILNDVYVATRYLKKNFPKQLFFPLPYDETKELEVKKVEKLKHDYVYIGHDYDRREKMIEFFFSFAQKYPQYKVEIFGNWDKWLSTKKYSEKYPKEILKGSIAQADGFDVLNKSLATCKVIPKWAEEYGHITGGFHEAVMMGCPLLADKDINTIEKYIINDNIVSSGDDVFKRLEELKIQSYSQRKEMVEEQRKIFRKLRINKIFDNILNKVLSE